MTIETQINQAMTMHCKALKIIDNIEENIKQQLYTTQEYPFTLESAQGYNTDGEWSMEIYIKYPTLFSGNIDTSYQVVQAVKKVFDTITDSTITYSQSINGLAIKVIIEGEADG
jgi:hypothetical protein